MSDNDKSGHIVDRENLPKNFPTHRHSAAFWEALGRTVATFGFLEEVLGKAIFSFTATRRISADRFEAEFETWLSTLERALSDPLGGLIDAYGKAVRNNKEATIVDLDDLLAELRSAAILRNVICHGSWRTPDQQGKSLAFFVDKKNRVFDTPVDVLYLFQLQRSIAELACDIISSVSSLGWQFPGSSGPGKPIYEKS